MQPKVTRTERSSQGKNRNSSLIGHTSGVALIRETKHLPALLELPTWSIRLPWELILHSAIVTHFTMERHFKPRQPSQQILGIMRHCLLTGHKKGGPSPLSKLSYSGSHPRRPRLRSCDFSRRSPNVGPWTCENRTQSVRNGPGTIPVGHMYGVGRSSKALNLVAKLRMNASCCDNCDHTSI